MLTARDAHRLKYTARGRCGVVLLPTVPRAVRAARAMCGCALWLGAPRGVCAAVAATSTAAEGDHTYAKPSTMHVVGGARGELQQCICALSSP